MALADLQAVLDESLARSSPLMRELFAAGQWDAARVEALIREKGGITIATVNPDGHPHAALVIGGCTDGVIHFTVSRGSALRRNLRRDPRVAFTVGESVMGQGRALRTGSASALAETMGRAGDSMSRLVREGWEGELYAILPSRLFASG